MGGVLVMCAALSAFVSGSCVGRWCHERRVTARRRRGVRHAMGADSALVACSVQLECEGIHARVLAFAVRLSMNERSALSGMARLYAAGLHEGSALQVKAGLAGVLTERGCALARLQLSLVGGVMGLIAGLPLSTLLGLMGFAVGTLWGWTALPRALAEEARERSFAAERQLSQMIEVVVLGIKSGMSFDRALSLYTQRFEGSLSRALALAQGQWRHGLLDRGDGLRSVAESYDSPLFARFAENVVRSLRFGTSLADNLNVLALEARATRKAKLEEKVAKAPVKMLLPVGALILPAMLILILGPIMLDLMEGF